MQWYSLRNSMCLPFLHLCKQHVSVSAASGACDFNAGRINLSPQTTVGEDDHLDFKNIYLPLP